MRHTTLRTFNAQRRLPFAQRAMTTVHLVALTHLAALCGACGNADPAMDGGEGGAKSPTNTGGDTNTEAQGPEVLVGTFNVDLVAENPLTTSPAYATSFGGVNDGPSPNPRQFEVVATEGDCLLQTPVIPSCTTSCGPDAQCVGDNECQPYPTPLDIGTVALGGVSLASGKDELVMNALEPSNKYQALGEQLLYPPFGESSLVTLTSSGETVAPLSLQAPTIAPLDVQGEDPLMIQPNTAADLTWVAAADPGASSIRVTFDISHHGGLKGELVCETADDGAITVPAPLVTALIDLGFSGFPVVHLERVSVASAQTRVGRVELVLRSAVNRDLEIPGLVSCDEVDASTGCPEGQTCQQDYRCAE